MTKTEAQKIKVFLDRCGCGFTYATDQLQADGKAHLAVKTDAAPPVIGNLWRPPVADCIKWREYTDEEGSKTYLYW